jgi:hypothetical protein
MYKTRLDGKPFTTFGQGIEYFELERSVGEEDAC